jgi:hypothetical protein
LLRSGDGCRSRAFTPDRSSARCILLRPLLWLRFYLF